MVKMDWKDKKVLVTGSEGMIGKELVEQLEKLKEEGTQLGLVDIKFGLDLKDYKECLRVCEGMDYVFHLAGIKGNPKMTNERPVDFMGPMLQFDTNMILAAQEAGVKKFLYTSSIAVENPETDKYPAWAKQTAETLIDAMRIQYPKGTEYCIVRPANVYGRFDNFDNPDAMVVTALINKALKNKKIDLMTDGTEVRDFINAKDVARGMIQAMEQMPKKPVNLCSGKGITILQLCDEIIKNTTDGLLITRETKKADCKKRVMKINWDFEPKIGIEEGIREVIKYVRT